MIMVIYEEYDGNSDYDDDDDGHNDGDDDNDCHHYLSFWTVPTSMLSPPMTKFDHPNDDDNDGDDDDEVNGHNDNNGNHYHPSLWTVPEPLLSPMTICDDHNDHDDDVDDDDDDGGEYHYYLSLRTLCHFVHQGLSRWFQLNPPLTVPDKLGFFDMLFNIGLRISRFFSNEY